MAGVFAVARKLFTEPDRYWWPTGPWSKREAWLYIVATAEWEEKHGIRRGQVLVSIRESADVWRWSRNRVRRFLEELVERGALSFVTEKTDPPRGKVYVVANYDKYSFGGPAKRDRSPKRSPQPKRTPSRTPSRTPVEQTEIGGLPARVEKQSDPDVMPAQEIVKAWMSTLEHEISPADFKRQMVPAKRLSETRPRAMIQQAMVGITQLYEHRDKGAPWDLWALEKKFVTSLSAAASHPRIKSQKRDQEIRDALGQ